MFAIDKLPRETVKPVVRQVLGLITLHKVLRARGVDDVADNGQMGPLDGCTCLCVLRKHLLGQRKGHAKLLAPRAHFKLLIVGVTQALVRL